MDNQSTEKPKVSARLISHMQHMNLIFGIRWERHTCKNWIISMSWYERYQIWRFGGFEVWKYWMNVSFLKNTAEVEAGQQIFHNKVGDVFLGRWLTAGIQGHGHHTETVHGRIHLHIYTNGLQVVKVLRVFWNCISKHTRDTFSNYVQIGNRQKYSREDETLNPPWWSLCTLLLNSSEINLKSEVN